jgi:hypothetical protein
VSAGSLTSRRLVEKPRVSENIMKSEPHAFLEEHSRMWEEQRCQS